MVGNDNCVGCDRQPRVEDDRFTAYRSLELSQMPTATFPSFTPSSDPSSTLPSASPSSTLPSASPSSTLPSASPTSTQSWIILLGRHRKLEAEDVPEGTIKTLQREIHDLYGVIPFSIYSVDGIEVRGMTYRSGEFTLLEEAKIVQITTIYCVNTPNGAKVFFAGRMLIENGPRDVPELISRGDKKVAQCMPCNHSVLYDTSLIVDKAICFHACLLKDDIVAYNAPPMFPCCQLTTTNSPKGVKTTIQCTRRNPFYYVHNLTRKYRLLYLCKADKIPHYRIE